jgi:hypothetical protein
MVDQVTHLSTTRVLTELLLNEDRDYRPTSSGLPEGGARRAFRHKQPDGKLPSTIAVEAENRASGIT